MNKCYVFLPVFNEQDAILRLLEDIRGVLNDCGVPFHLLVVDDGSTDGTPRILAEEVRKRGEDLTVLTHARNRGIDGVFRTGLLHVAEEARPEDCAIVMEADATNDLDSLPPMVEALRAGNDLVIASRFVSGGEIRGFPPRRWLATWAVNHLLQVVFRVKGVTDFTIFFRGYSVRLLQDAIRTFGERIIETTGFVANAEILVKLKKLEPRVSEVPLVYRYDCKESISKLKVGFTIRQYLRLMAVHILSRRFR